ncbi:hypothetical protein PUNSTDRAFT_144900 [Punctularia strigosozonata HHB-11173 SS5]|uniref:uncharacterized protein n=1 Tax=Punctularia strigosozonata (strain HHB-11173) TaxID=741275 RepID=UPI000441853C|nr:uncharacterized protein PUNSTDRAFT_144900 [Punctularia strigosozonata HHB-11173 SS5]EIN07414.1 hypothetical protein PUNSTDRAFT_144900 [Punctularia strigosozonata HHB-11173 SS5]
MQMIIPTVFDSAVSSWISYEFRGRDRSGKEQIFISQLAMPYLTEPGTHCTLAPPSDITGYVEWVEALPLQTAQAVVHHNFPDTRSLSFVPGIDDHDREIFRHFVWGSKSADGHIRGNLVVAIQPSWIVSDCDLNDFVGCKTFPLKKLTPEDKRGAPVAARRLRSNRRLWAKLWDTCYRYRSRFFVLSTYEGWVFGSFSIGWTTGFVSPVKTFDVHAPTILHCLIYWLSSASARGHSRWITPIVSGEPSDDEGSDMFDEAASTAVAPSINCGSCSMVRSTDSATWIGGALLHKRTDRRPDRRPKTPLLHGNTLEDPSTAKQSVTLARKRDVADSDAHDTPPAEKRRRRSSDDRTLCDGHDGDTPMFDARIGKTDALSHARRGSHTAIPVYDLPPLSIPERHLADTTNELQEPGLRRFCPLSPITTPGFNTLPPGPHPVYTTSLPEERSPDIVQDLRPHSGVHPFAQPSYDPESPTSPLESRYGVTAPVLKDRVLIWRRGVPYPDIRPVFAVELKKDPYVHITIPTAGPQPHARKRKHSYPRLSYEPMDSRPRRHTSPCFC